MQHHTSSKPGFTLIELLVVIAIIGILSAVVLASLSSARLRGTDAAIKQSLAGARSQSELFYAANNNRYVGTVGSSDDVCALNSSVSGVKGISDFAQEAARTSGAGAALNLTLATVGNTSRVTCHATPNTGSGMAPLGAWAIEAPLRDTYAGYTNPMWCVDSSGVATTTSGSTLAASDAACR